MPHVIDAIVARLNEMERQDEIDRARRLERVLRLAGHFELANEARERADALIADRSHFPHHDICGECGKQADDWTDRCGGMCVDCEEKHDAAAWEASQGGFLGDPR